MADQPRKHPSQSDVIEFGRLIWEREEQTKKPYISKW
jgi:hypothetical protein